MKTSKKILALVLATLFFVTSIPVFALDAEAELTVEETEQTEQTAASAEDVAEDTAEESGDETAEESTDEIAEESADKTTEEPTEEIAEESGDETADEPVEEPSEPVEESEETPEKESEETPAEETEAEEETEVSLSETATLALAVDEPIFGHRPDTEIAATADYVATVEWIGADGAQTEKFGYYEAHTVNIYLVPSDTFDIESYSVTINGNEAAVEKLATCYKLSYTFPASNVRNVYYVSANGSDSGDGSKIAPYATIDKAFSMLTSTGGVIYITDNITAANGCYLPANAKPVLITGEGYEGAAITLPAGKEFAISGDVTFEHIDIACGTSCNYNDRGHKLVFGEGVTGNIPFLHAGSYGGSSDSPSVDSVDITLGGELSASHITLGGAYLTNALDGVAHDIKLTFNGATTTAVRLGPDHFNDTHTTAVIGGNILVTTNAGPIDAFGELTIPARRATMSEDAAIQFIYNNDTQRGTKDYKYIMGEENMYYVFSGMGGRVDHALDENGHSIRGFFDIIPDKDHVAIVDISGEKTVTYGGRIEIPADTYVYVTYVKAANNLENITIETNGGEGFLGMIEIDEDGRVWFNDAPTHPTGIFEGWYADAELTTLVENGDNVGTDCAFYAKYYTISRDIYDCEFVVEGVQVRLPSGTTVPQGLRFISDISNDLITAVAGFSSRNPARMRPNADGIGYGSVVLPAQLLGEQDLLCDAKYESGGKVYASKTVPAAKLYHVTGDVTKYTVVISDIAAEKYGNEYAARPYIRYYSRSGNVVTAYGDAYDVSVYSAASAVIEAGEVDADTISYLKTEVCQAFAEAKGLNVASETLISEIETQRQAMRDAVVNSANTYDPADFDLVYYVSSSGGTYSTGTSTTSPVNIYGLYKKTSNYINPAISSGKSVLVLFKRGDTFRLDYTEDESDTKLEILKGVVYSAYGEGAKPILTASLANYASSSYWTNVSGNYYKFSGSQPSDNVGIIEFTDSTGQSVLGTKKMVGKEYDGKAFSGYTDLKGDLEFCNIDGVLYLYSEGSPASRFTSIEIGNQDNILHISQPDVTIDNIHFRIAGGHGISANGKDAVFDEEGNYTGMSSGTAANLTVTNCIFEKIGGSQHYSYTEPTRYGNAIEIFGSCDGFYVSNNWIHDIYDTGITFQYTADYVVNSMQQNVEIRDNLIERCLWGFEFYNQHISSDYQRITRDILFTENMICDIGRGWCDLDGRTGHVAAINSYGLSRNAADVENFVISNNIIYRPTNHLIRLQEETEKSIVFSGNTWIQDYEKPLGSLFGEVITYDENAGDAISSVIGETESGGVYYYIP